MAWPKFRYQTNSITLQDIKAPSFPNASGTQFYSFPIRQNPQYIVTTRNIPTVAGQWTCENLSQTNRNSMFTFWDTNLSRGESDFTMIDHRKRMLFGVSWNEWQETWKKLRTGVGDVFVDFESPYPWTPPLFGFYPSTTNNLVCHTLDTTGDLTVGDGAMTDYATDNNVLRRNGYALRLSEQVAAATGASNTGLSWFQGKDNSSITLFCQCSIPDLNSGRSVEIMKLTDGNNILRIYAGISTGSSSSTSSTSSASSASSGSTSSTSTSSSTTYSSSTASSTTVSSLSTASSTTQSSSQSASSSTESSSSSSSSGDTTLQEFTFEWQKTGESAESLLKTDLKTELGGNVAWYDIALTFDNINNNFHAYIERSARNTLWTLEDDFLYGAENLNAGVLNDTSPTNYPEDVTWTELYLLKGDAADIFVDNSEYAYIQNVMVIDDFVSPLGFNILRRLCHLWNMKTGSTWPK